MFSETDLTFLATLTLHLAIFAPEAVLTVTTALPGATPLITPFELTLTIFLSEEDKTTAWFAEAGLTVALRLIFSPMSRYAELLSRETEETGLTTLTTHLALNEPSLVLTVMFAVPGFFAVTTPFCETTATFLLEEPHLTSLKNASEGLTEAVRVIFLPMLIVAEVLLSLTPVTDLITVTLTEALTVLSGENAVITAVPFDLPVTAPLELTEATDLSLETQVSAEFVAVAGSVFAVNVFFCPTLTFMALALSLTEVRFCLTVTLQLAFAFPSPETAVIIAVPPDTAVIFPLWLTFAVLLFEDDHLTVLLLAVEGLIVAETVFFFPTQRVTEE